MLVKHLVKHSAYFGQICATLRFVQSLKNRLESSFLPPFSPFPTFRTVELEGFSVKKGDIRIYGGFERVININLDCW